jgi:hypothetical protein
MSFRSHTCGQSNGPVSTSIPRHMSSTLTAHPRADSFDLMGLPREMRDLIWHFLWLETPRIGPIMLPGPPPKGDSPGQQVLEVTYGGDLYVMSDDGKTKKQLDGLPSWLRTSPQILSEGLHLMRLNAVWKVSQVALTREFMAGEGFAAWAKAVHRKAKGVPEPGRSPMSLLSPLGMSTWTYTTRSLGARTHHIPSQWL